MVSIEVLNYTNFGNAHIYLMAMALSETEYIFVGQVLLQEGNDFRLENFMMDRNLENLVFYY